MTDPAHHDPDNTTPSDPGKADALFVASSLANFFEAGWSIQVLVGDVDRAQYEASRLARPQAERHLAHMAEIAAALPRAVRAQMPKIDWESWVEIGQHLPPRTAYDRALVWTAISAWLPETGAVMRRYRRQLPALWRFRL